MIAIKDIEIPPGCMDCKFLYQDPSGSYCFATNDCREIDGGVDQYETHRVDWCPLIEIVQCKDCKFNYANFIPSEDSCFKFVNLPINKDFYCACGEIKSNDY